MTSKLDMVKARNLSIISVLSAGVLAAGLVFTGVISQEETVEGTDVAEIYAGRNTSFVLDNEGTLWAKGANNVGQLGVGDYENKSDWTAVQIPEDETIKKVSVGETHSTVLTESDAVYVFGDNRAGVIGDGSTSVSLSPKKVSAVPTYSMLTAGYGFVIAVGSDGNLYGWGKNNDGQLGIRNKTNQPEPALIDYEGSPIVDLKAGKNFVIALADDGTMLSWGANDKGQLGLGDKKDRTEPTKIPLEEEIASINTNLTAETVVAITTDGRLFTWGANDKGQLGNGTDWREEIRLEEERVAAEIERIEEADEARLETLIQECVAERTEDWEEENPPEWEEIPAPLVPQIEGDEEEGTDDEEEPEFGWVTPDMPDFQEECSEEETENFEETDTSDITPREIEEPELADDSDEPEHIGGNERFSHASIGAQNGAAISRDLKLYTWGADAKGQNGNDIEDSSSHTQLPKIVESVQLQNFTKAEVSNGWAIALDQNGNIQAWGESTSGALSSAGPKSLTPANITLNTDLVVGDIYVGAQTGYLTDTSDINYSWGGNSSGVLGYDPAEAEGDPFVEIGRQLTEIAPAGDGVIALGGDRNLYGWGTDQESIFGEDAANETVQRTPRRVQAVTEFADVSAGHNFTVAVDLDGDIWVWGSNNTGIDGGSSGGNILRPVKVSTPGVTVFSKVQAAREVVYAFTNSDKIVSWGAGRSFTEIDVPASDYSVSSTAKGVSLLTESGDLWVTTYDPALTDHTGVPKQSDSDDEETASESEPFVEEFIKYDGTYSAVSKSVTNQSIAQTTDDQFVIWGTGLPSDLEEAANNTYEIILPLPRMTEIAMSSTHYMMFDTNHILWMWGEDPSGVFKNKGFVSTPQSNIFTAQKADN